MIDYSKFKVSLQRLEEQEENHRTLDASLPDLMRDAVAESVIQRFETCYDCLWNVLKRDLNEELGIADVPNSPKPIFRLANENDMLSSQIAGWLRFANARIDTSHDYDGEMAKACLGIVPEYIERAIALYQTMSDKRWR